MSLVGHCWSRRWALSTTDHATYEGKKTSGRDARTIKDDCSAAESPRAILGCQKEPGATSIFESIEPARGLTSHVGGLHHASVSIQAAWHCRLQYVGNTPTLNSAVLATTETFGKVCRTSIRLHHITPAHLTHFRIELQSTDAFKEADDRIRLPQADEPVNFFSAFKQLPLQCLVLPCARGRSLRRLLARCRAHHWRLGQGPSHLPSDRSG